MRAGCGFASRWAHRRVSVSPRSLPEVTTLPSALFGTVWVLSYRDPGGKHAARTGKHGTPVLYRNSSSFVLALVWE